MCTRLINSLAVVFGFLMLQACAAPLHQTPSPDPVSPTSTGYSHHAPRHKSADRSASAESSTAPSPAPSRSVAGKSYGAPSTSYQQHRYGAYRDDQPSRSYQQESRPGLGTAYGENVRAPVHQVSFQRQSSQPHAVIQMHYNNPAGVYAMARYLGGVSCCGTISSTAGAGVRARLTDQYGNSLRGLHSGGRVWVMGQHGSRYRIHLQNHSSRRVEVVVSVDGLDVIDGQRGSYHKRGYIILPYGNVWIDGFRRSFQHVAAFRFSSVSNSYAARTSGDRNVGVVGVAVFPEALPTWNPHDLHQRNSASPFSQPPQ